MVSASNPIRPEYYSSYKGDELNLRYGGLHRGDVPKYRRIGGKFSSNPPIIVPSLDMLRAVPAGRVIGLNDGLRITKETAYTGRGVEIAPSRQFQVRLGRAGTSIF